MKTITTFIVLLLLAVTAWSDKPYGMSAAVASSHASNACDLLSASDVQAVFGQAMTMKNVAPEVCEFTQAANPSALSVQLTVIHYDSSEAASKGLVFVSGGKRAKPLTDLGEQAARFRDNALGLTKVTVRKGLTVFSIHCVGPLDGEIALQNLQTLARQIAGKV